MIFQMSRLILLSCLIFVGFASVYSQTSADNKSMLPSVKPGDDDKESAPKNFRESLVKMRIDKDKKDHEEMVERGEEIVKLTEEIEKSLESSGHFTEKERPKLATVEKLVKKIRNELGAGDDEGDDGDPTTPPIQRTNNLSPLEAIKTLRTSTAVLYEELKKTTRFSISASAIQSSNAVLKITKFLRLSN
ncbi:hypothetical protein BH10ACI2_BH10ACI2_23580 [soil metagenome]